DETDFVAAHRQILYPEGVGRARAPDERALPFASGAPELEDHARSRKPERRLQVDRPPSLQVAIGLEEERYQECKGAKKRQRKHGCLPSRIPYFAAAVTDRTAIPENWTAGRLFA